MKSIIFVTFVAIIMMNPLNSYIGFGIGIGAFYSRHIGYWNIS